MKGGIKMNKKSSFCKHGYLLKLCRKCHTLESVVEESKEEEYEEDEGMDINDQKPVHPDYN